MNSGYSTMLSNNELADGDGREEGILWSKTLLPLIVKFISMTTVSVSSSIENLCSVNLLRIF